MNMLEVVVQVTSAFSNPPKIKDQKFHNELLGPKFIFKHLVKKLLIQSLVYYIEMKHLSTPRLLF